MNHFYSNARQRQSGTALLVALIMIFMISVMGISAMRSSTLESRMAANAIQTANAFQAAESSTEILLNDHTNLEAALADMDNGYGFQTEDELNGSAISLDSRADTLFVGYGAAPGWSLGESSTGFAAIRFRTTGTGTITAVRANSVVEQGAFRIAPTPSVN